MAIFLTTNVLVDVNLIGRPAGTSSSRQAAAQAANPTTFYFKNDGTPASGYWGVAGPTVKYSSLTDADANVPTAKTTAGAMHPIAGPIVLATTFDSIFASRTTGASIESYWYRTFIMPLAINTTFTNNSLFTAKDSATESDALANAYQNAFMYVYNSIGNNKSATLAGPTECTTEVGNNTTTNSGQVWPLTPAVTGGSYTTVSGDYLAVELWVTFKGVSSPYTVTLYWGGNVPVVHNSGSNTTPASVGWVGGTVTGDITSDPIYFLPTSIPPPDTSPDASQTGDTFQTSTMDFRRMSTVPGTGAETSSQTVSTTPGNWRMNIFVSPPMAAQTIPAGNWIIHLHGYEANAAANAQIRGMIYTWNANDTLGDTIISVRNGGTEWTTATTNNQFELIWAGSAATITAGERLVAEWNVVTITSSGAYEVRDYFGSTLGPTISTYDSSILPPMNYTSSPAAISWRAATYDETYYRFDEDNDNVEIHTAWTNGNGANIDENTAAAYNTGIKFRLRIQIRNIGAESDTLQPKLEYQINSPPGSWTEIIPNSGTIQIIASDQAGFVDGTATTRQLTDQTGYNFTAGDEEEDSSPSGDTTMIRWNFTEYEWSLKAIGSTETYNIRANDNGSAFNTYTNTPQVTISGYTPKMNNWQWYGDEMTITSAEALTTPYAAENTAPPQVEMGKSIPMKLRINLTETGGIGENDSRKKLQYSIGTEGPPWYTVGETTATLYPWRFYNGGGDDDAFIYTVVLTGTTAGATGKGTLNESSSSAPNSDHTASATVEWEFCIENYNADASTTYYFNLYDEVLAANIPLATDKIYPRLTTAAAYDLTINSPASVGLGDYPLGSGSYHEYTFNPLSESITIRDNRGQTAGNSSGWSCAASVSTELNYRDPGTFGTPVFNGSGPNDILRQGSYTGSVDSSYLITITGTGTPNDAASWSNAVLGEGSFIEVSEAWQYLGGFGLAVRWGSATGHTIGDNWTISATAGTLWTITDDSTYWISDSITGLYAAPTTGISTQPGSYMGSPVTAASVSGSGKNGLGGFIQVPTLRIYNAIHVGDYTGSITLTLT